MSIQRMVDANTIFGLWPRSRVDISIKTLLGLLSSHNVTRACSISARGIFYDFREGNEETLRESRIHPEIIPVCTVNPAAYLGWQDEVEMRIDEGCRIFRFFPRIQEWSIDGLVFRRFLDRISNSPEVLLMIPASEGIPNIARVAGGMSNPVLITSFRYTDLSEAIEAMNSHPNLYIDTHMINSPDFLQVLKEYVGLDRVVFGSNAPLSYLSSALLPILKAHVPEAEKQGILGGNLERLLGGEL